MTKVIVENLTKSYKNNIAVENLNFEINDGEFLTLLGESGCGKTTTLRLILGSIFPDKGKIYFDGKDITNVPCQKRNVGIVYQDYALFPHMTIYENIAFGLKIRKEKNIENKIDNIMKILRISGLEKRYPHQLSGGQQQRVAIARTLVVKPKLLLLDEPLSNIDAKLRFELTEELKNMQKTTKITTLYVTHDQEEALTISDRIAIMHDKTIIEIGTPSDLYFNSKNDYTRHFFDVITKRLIRLNHVIKG